MDGKEDSLRSSWSTNNRYSRTLPREQELFGKQNSFRYRRNEYDWKNYQLYDEYKKTKEIENELEDEIVYVNSDELEEFLERNCLIYIEESDSEDENANDVDKDLEKDDSSDSDDDSTSKSYISDEGEKPPPRILYKRLIIMEKERVKIKFEGMQDETDEENDEIHSLKNDNRLEDINDLDDENIYMNQNNLYLNILFGEDIFNLQDSLNLDNEFVKEKIMKLQNVDIQVIPPGEKLNFVIRSNTEANIFLKREAHEQIAGALDHKPPSTRILEVHLVPSKGVIKSLSDSKVFEKIKLSKGTGDQNISSFLEFSQQQKGRNSDEDTLENKNQEEDIDIWAGRESPVSRIKTKPNIKNSNDDTFENDSTRMKSKYDDTNDVVFENENQEEIDIWSGRESPISRIKAKPKYNNINDYDFEYVKQEDEIDIWADRESPAPRVRKGSNCNDTNNISDDETEEEEEEEFDIWAGKESPAPRMKRRSNCNDTNDTSEDEIEKEEVSDIWADRESPAPRVRKGSNCNDTNNISDDETEEEEEFDIFAGKESPAPRVKRRSNCYETNDTSEDEIEKEEVSDIWAGRESPAPRVRKGSNYNDTNNISDDETEEEEEEEEKEEEEFDIWAGKESPSLRVKRRSNSDDTNETSEDEIEREEVSDIWAGRESPVSWARAKQKCEDTNDSSISENEEKEIDIWSGRESPVSKFKTRPVSRDRTITKWDDTNDHSFENENQEEEFDLWEGRKSPAIRVRNRPNCVNTNDTSENDIEEISDIWIGRESPVSKDRTNLNCDDANPDFSENDSQKEDEIDIWTGRESPASKARTNCDDTDDISENEIHEEIDIFAGRESPTSRVRTIPKGDDYYFNASDKENWGSEIDIAVGNFNETVDYNSENEKTENDVDIWAERESPTSIERKLNYGSLNEGTSEKGYQKDEIDIWAGKESPTRMVTIRSNYEDTNDTSEDETEEEEEIDIWSGRKSSISRVRTRPKCDNTNDHIFENEDQKEECGFWEGKEPIASSIGSKSSCDKASNCSSENENSEEEVDIWIERESSVFISRGGQKSKCDDTNNDTSDTNNEDSEEGEFFTWVGRGSPITRTMTRPKYENTNDNTSENENTENGDDIWVERESLLSVVETSFNCEDSHKKNQEEPENCSGRESPESPLRTRPYSDDINSNPFKNVKRDEEIANRVRKSRSSCVKTSSKDDDFYENSSVNENMEPEINIRVEEEIPTFRVRIRPKVNNNPENKNQENETNLGEGRKSPISRVRTRSRCNETNDNTFESENQDENITIGRESSVTRIRGRSKLNSVNYDNSENEIQEESNSCVEIKSPTSRLRQISISDDLSENREETHVLTSRVRITSENDDFNSFSSQKENTEEVKRCEGEKSTIPRVRKRPKYVERNNITPKNENVNKVDDCNVRQSPISRVRTRKRPMTDDKVLDNENYCRNFETVSNIHSRQNVKSEEYSENSDADKEDNVEAESESENDCGISYTDGVNYNNANKNIKKNFLSTKEGPQYSPIQNICEKREKSSQNRLNDADVKLAYQNISNNDKVNEYLKSIHETQNQESKTDPFNKRTSGNTFGLSSLIGYKKMLNFFNIPKNLNSHLIKFLETFNLISGNDAIPSQFPKGDKELKDELNEIISDLDSSLIGGEISEQSLGADDAKKVEYNLEKFNLLEEDFGYQNEVECVRVKQIPQIKAKNKDK